MSFSVHILTLFPEVFPGVLGASLTGRALNDGIWTLHAHNFRDFGLTKHKNVDDTPFGGGAGLVLRPDVLGASLENALKNGAKKPLIALSPRGKSFSQKRAQELAQGSGMTLICGRFEGFDQRFLDYYEIEEISMGDYVLTGGEIAAQALIDATIRLIDGTIGNSDSVEEESFSSGLLEYPQYTKPSVWQSLDVPSILRSGHHQQIAQWRKEQAEDLTKKRRPDLWRAYMDTKGEAEQSDE